MEKITSLISKLERPQSGHPLAARSLPAGTASVFIGRDPVGQLHLLVGFRGAPPEWTDELQARGIRTSIRDLQLGKSFAKRFVDVHFLADEESNLAAPFLGFTEDFVDRVRQEGGNSLNNLRLVFDEWKHFWQPEPQQFTEQWLRGLSAELLFMEQAILLEGPHIALAWAGPDAPQDFQRGKIAFELKSSASLPHRPTISSIDQLSRDSFDALYLACVLIDRNGQNDSLDRLVTRVRKLLGSDKKSGRHFETTLKAFQYEARLEHEYAQQLFSFGSIDVFVCDANFPGLTREMLNIPLDERVLSVAYRLSLTGVTALQIKDHVVRSHLRKLAGHG